MTKTCREFIRLNKETIMKKLMLTICVAFALPYSLIGCASSEGPTYPVVGTVSQKEMEKAADASRLSYYALISIAAEYTDLPRCASAQPQPCSSQVVVNEIRRVRSAAGIATKGAVDIATSPTKSPLALANAVNDAQRAVALFKNVLAAVRPEAKEVK